MRKNPIVSDFHKWNDNSPIAAGILRRDDGGNYQVMATNPALKKRFGLSDAPLWAELCALLGCEVSFFFPSLSPEPVKRSCFSSELGGYLTCTCSKISEGTAAFWIAFDHEREKALLDSLPVGIVCYHVSADGNALSASYINETTREISGLASCFPQEENNGACLKDNLHPQDIGFADEAAKVFLSGTPSKRFELRLVHPDGDIRWISGSTDRLVPGNSCLTVYQDITDLKNAESSERHTSTLLEKILVTTQSAIFWKDDHRRFLGANRAFLDYYDFPSVEAILGKNDEDMGWHTNPDPFKNDEWQVLCQGIGTNRVLGTCLSHGEDRIIAASKAPMYENRKIVGLVGSFEDITNEARQREKIEVLNAQLAAALASEKRASQAKTDFLARMSTICARL